MKFARIPITSNAEYQAMQARGVDFCDGCGGRFPVAYLEEASLEASGGFPVPGLVCRSCRQILSYEQKETSPVCLAALDSSPRNFFNS